MSTLYEHVVHPHIAHREAHGPIKVADQHDRSNPFARFNTALALWVTKVVGSMWCAYAFAILDFVSLPAAIRGGTATLIQWIAQTFLQLVLLSIIMVGQNVQADAADKRSEATYKDTEALLHGQEQAAAHLAVQDRLIAEIAKKLDIDVEQVVRAAAAAVEKLQTPAPAAAAPVAPAASSAAAPAPEES